MLLAAKYNMERWPEETGHCRHSNFENSDKQGLSAGKFHPWGESSNPFYSSTGYNKPLHYLIPTKHPSCSSVILNYLELSKTAKHLCPCPFLCPGCPTGEFLLTLKAEMLPLGMFPCRTSPLHSRTYSSYTI